MKGTSSMARTEQESFDDRFELQMQIAEGELDVGLDDKTDPDERVEKERERAMCDMFRLEYKRRDSGTSKFGGVNLREYVSDRLGREKDGCFSIACGLAGVVVDKSVRRVHDLSKGQLLELASKQEFKMVLVVYGNDDPRNHVTLVHAVAKNANVLVKVVEGDEYTFVCTTMQHFFNDSNEWAKHYFYATGDTDFGGFGSDSRPETVPAPGSVVDEGAQSGASNVSGGVVRVKRRTIGAKSRFASGYTSGVAKNYRASNAVMFNNAEELFQDTISRDFAQEIMETLFDAWGVPSEDADAMKYAEDLLWMFIIASTASNKADYNKEVDIPVKPYRVDGEWVSSVTANFAVFSQLLQSKFGVTRRQFARGVADDMKNYLRHEENQSILPALATRVGCDDLMAYLAFDGATHCTGMTTREIAFTKTLEKRNLFERADEGAADASERLMQGMSGGVRSVAPR